MGIEMAAEDGCVIDWTIRDLRTSGEGETAEWAFHYRWRGEEKRFDGATIATLRDGKLSYLREYATTAALYDWRGEWHLYPIRPREQEAEYRG